ncbi:MAG: YciI family protein [Anaerolineae bacterium]
MVCPDGRDESGGRAAGQQWTCAHRPRDHRAECARAETLTIDGPFAETHEQFGGYFLLECKDLDEAIGWAARIPHAMYGSVEVRPLWSEQA